MATRSFFSVFIISIFFIGCSSNKATLSILDKNDASFPSIKITNPYGNDIIFSTNEKEGSIGYILNDSLVWIKGKPEISKSSKEETFYNWEKVSLRVIEKEGEKKLSFRLNANDKPSQWLINIEAGAGEYFTGIFERVVDGSQKESWKTGITTGLNLRGEKVEVKLKPTVSAYAPFFISSENYSFFVHGTWPGVIDFCKAKNNLIQIAFEGPEFSFSITTDKNPAALVKRHALATGPSFVPPKWALGPWRWRDDHNNNKTYFDGSKVTAPYNSDIVEDVLMMQAYDIPMTAYWIDRPWGPGPRGFDDYKIDYKRLPHFKEMIKWMNAKGIEMMLWIGPFVMGDMADVAEQNGYQLISKTWKKSRQVLMDFTNKKACKWWAENGPGKLAKMGIKGYKLDRADGEKLCDSLHLSTSIGTSYRENFNDYPRQYVKATYEAVKPILGNDFILFPRAQYTGSAKYGAMWAGDTGNPQEGLRSAVIGMQRCAIMGYPIWGSDTGGYPKRMERENTFRWMGFSCFSPIMEVGPTNNLGFWGMNYEPSFDKEMLAVWRFYSKIRMSMIDYLYTCMKNASTTGMPVARPLFLEYPEQKESWKNWDTYKLGDDLLVSVIWEKGKTQQKVYLPAGETWVDLWTNKTYEGGKYITVEAQLYQIPVFLKKRSQLTLPDFNKLYKESVKKTAIQYKMKNLENKEWGKN